MDYFLHKLGLCESTNIGDGTKIWAFTHVLPGAKIGRDCNICDHVFIEDDVVIGDRVTIKSGVQLWNGVSIEDDVFIGPNVTFTNDKFPRSKKYQSEVMKTLVKKNSSIGANATILPGVIIGENAMIGAGAVVTKSIPPFAVTVGNPARIVGHVLKDCQQIDTNQEKTNSNLFDESFPIKPSIAKLKQIIDTRGTLTILEFQSLAFFDIRRAFFIHDVPTGVSRGGHAHKECWQFIFNLKGRVSVNLQVGSDQRKVQLQGDGSGVVVSPLTWVSLDEISPDCLIVVFASHPFEEKDYIRDYQTYLNLFRSPPEIL